jgi:cytosine/adenosine deaminase-related metal-dependent hydrolase
MGAVPVVFFDLFDGLVVPAGSDYALRQDALALVPEGARLGIVANTGPYETGRDLEKTVQRLGLFDRVEPGLVVVGTNLPFPFPDRRAFGVAAALAEEPLERCIFVSSSPQKLAAATAAGMRTIQLAPLDAAAPPAVPAEPAAPVPGTPVPAVPAVPAVPPVPAEAEAAAAAPASAPRLTAGEVDEDRGPTFVLRGRVVTGKRGESLPNAQLVVARGQVRAVVPEGEELPSDYRSAPVLDTGGTVFPGLIDLHNHFAYNILPLFGLPKKYLNRDQWTTPTYKSEVTRPLRAVGGLGRTARCLARYVECKALIGGTTTGQGMKTQIAGRDAVYRGAMRNVEETNDKRLPEAGTRVPDIDDRREVIKSFRDALKRRKAYFYHLSEGVDERTRKHFLRLREQDLLQPSLVGVHALALQAADYEQMAAVGAKIVWSPFSNMLLYGQTLDLAAVRKSGVPMAMGCDWTPTGSKNLLQELKVARWAVEQQEADLTSEDLVRAVTTDAAAVTAWQEHVGTLTPGAFADLVVVAGADGDPWDALIDSTEADVELVVIHGVPRYGAVEPMRRLHSEPDKPLEEVSVAGRDAAFHLYTPGAVVNDLGFGPARKVLEEGMGDLYALQDEAAEESSRLQSMGMAPAFTIALDNEYEPDPAGLSEEDAVTLLADIPMVKSMDLDPPEVGAGDYWDRIDEQPNIDDGLKTTLKRAYGA